MRSVNCGRVRLLSIILGLSLLVGPAMAELTYTVQTGDTLSEIAQRFAVPLDALVTLNNIADPNRITAGQVLKLPEGAAVPAETATPSATPTPPEKRSPETTPRELTGRELLEYRAQALAEQRKARGEQMVTIASSFSGTPYQRGGLSSRGMDCSGLVVRTMRAMGKNVPHHSATLFTMGEKVTYRELQPGDLVFFNTDGKGVSHVGIWVGDHKFIHASIKGGVKVSKIEGYYSKTLVGARRIQ